MDNGGLFVIIALGITMSKLSVSNLDTQAILNMEPSQQPTGISKFMKLKIELMISPSPPPPPPTDTKLST